jgi:multicomponent Na+:H+ antiporter subunit F
MLAAAGLIMIKVIQGPTVWDRILGFNLLSTMIILSILLYADFSERSYLIDIAIVYALLGFIGIVFISRFVQGKGKI